MFSKSKEEAGPAPAEEVEECLVLSNEHLAAVLNAKVDIANAATTVLTCASKMDMLSWQHKHATLERDAASKVLVENNNKYRECYRQALESVGIEEHDKWEIDLTSGEVSPKSDE